ncbi:MAG: uridine kinase, partial [Bacilli bacterium]|nr:uridine kinase [Bacilli bacterium]
TENRLKKLGGNVHWERFKERVLPDIRGALEYTTTDGLNRAYKPAPLTLVVGTYCMHKEFGEYWDMSFFLSIDPKEQIKRLAKRDISKLQDYKEKWIPMENAYFEKWKIKDKADVLLG